MPNVDFGTHENRAIISVLLRRRHTGLLTWQGCPLPMKTSVGAVSDCRLKTEVPSDQVGITRDLRSPHPDGRRFPSDSSRARAVASQAIWLRKNCVTNTAARLTPQRNNEALFPIHAEVGEEETALSEKALGIAGEPQHCGDVHGKDEAVGDA